MSVKTAPFFWLECDGCGVKSTVHDDFVAYSDLECAEESALGHDWLVEPSRHLCANCDLNVRCRECGEVIPMGRTECPEPECREDAADVPDAGLGTV